MEEEYLIPKCKEINFNANRQHNSSRELPLVSSNKNNDDYFIAIFITRIMIIISNTSCRKGPS